MRRRGRRKPKTVSYELIGRSSEYGQRMYPLVHELIEKNHEDLRDARIALAWCVNWKPDVDGRVTIGKCKKASDLDRELAAFDFVILLRKAFWLNLDVTAAQRRALLDHELEHGAVKRDENGEPVEDERGRNVYRLRKHDLEEFSVIVQRHGLWTADLERFAYSLQQSASSSPFLPCEQCEASPGWVYFTDEQGASRVRRCECYLAWIGNRNMWTADQVPA